MTVSEITIEDGHLDFASYSPTDCVHGASDFLSCHLFFFGTHMQHFVNAYEENMMGEANNIQNRYSILYIYVYIYIILM